MSDCRKFDSLTLAALAAAITVIGDYLAYISAVRAIEESHENNADKNKDKH